VNKAHYLKTWFMFFQQVVDGKKTFEFRKNDRNFQLDDILCLQEWDYKEQVYTGREVKVVVTFMLNEFPGMVKGYVVLGIKSLEERCFLSKLMGMEIECEHASEQAFGESEKQYWNGYLSAVHEAIGFIEGKIFDEGLGEDEDDESD